MDSKDPVPAPNTEAWSRPVLHRADTQEGSNKGSGLSEGSTSSGGTVGPGS